jgi:hypothetical protein
MRVAPIHICTRPAHLYSSGAEIVAGSCIAACVAADPGIAIFRKFPKSTGAKRLKYSGCLATQPMGGVEHSLSAAPEHRCETMAVRM